MPKREEEQAAESFYDSELGQESISFKSAEIIHCTTSEIPKHDNTKAVNEFARCAIVLDVVRSVLERKDAEIVGLKAREKDLDDKISTQDKLLKEGGEKLLNFKAMNLK